MILGEIPYILVLPRPHPSFHFLTWFDIWEALILIASHPVAVLGPKLVTWAASCLKFPAGVGGWEYQQLWRIRVTYPDSQEAHSPIELTAMEESKASSLSSGSSACAGWMRCPATGQASSATEVLQRMTLRCNAAILGRSGCFQVAFR